MKHSRLSAYHPIQIPLGLIIWSLWFVGMYGGLSVFCSVAAPDPRSGALTGVNLWLLAATVVTLVLLLWLARRFWQLSKRRDGLNERQVFVTQLSAGIHFVAAIATLYVGVPLLFLPPCV